MIIAVDGPTASGKGTIAKALAAHFSLPHLDTGLLYRAVGRQVALNGGNPDDPADALRACVTGSVEAPSCANNSGAMVNKSQPAKAVIWPTLRKLAPITSVGMLWRL